MRASALSSIVAAVAVAVGSVLIGAVVVVRSTMLDPSTYTSALVTTDAYERIYTEVLADPDLADLQEQLLGDLGVPDVLAPQARSLAKNALRWTVPPSTIRQLTERVIRSTLAYVRGDVARLRADLAVDAIAARVPVAAVREVRTLLAAAAERTVTSTKELHEAMRAVGDLLAAGEVPADIPKIGDQSFDPTAIAEAILDGLGDRVDDDLRTLVLAAVLAEDVRDAIIDAAAVVVVDHATVAAERLGAEPTVDLVALVADHAERPAGQLVATFDRARDLARWAGPWTAAAGGVLLVGGLGALWARHRRDLRRLAAWAAAGLVGGGVVTLAGWLVVRAVVRSPLVVLSDPGPHGWSLPPATAVLLGDVAREVGSRTSGTAWRYGVVLVLVGALVGTGSWLWRAIRTTTARRIAVVGLAAIGLVAFSAIVGSRPRQARVCNGAAELCERPYDEVTTAATHNSMSSPEVVPVWPEHDGGITEQLDAGVRTLLIDVLHWESIESAGQLAAIERPGAPRLPPALAEALLRTVVAVRDGRPGAFLCHIHCAFGAQPLADGLAEIAAFMATNPDEVVTLIIQDEIPAGEVTAVFESSGLTDLVHVHRPGRPWPTLGELIDDDERLVVFAENEGPPPAWYANAFESMQETPFLFFSSDDFSCVENRGRADTSLFLMNHWIQRIAPDRADATRVNRLDVLVDRARQCGAERGRAPNFLAVNFYNIGDVVEAAAVLNGVAD